MSEAHEHDFVTACFDCGAITSEARAAELSRLQSVVIDAARGWHRPAADDRWYESRLRDAVDALVEFESGDA